MKVSYQPLLFFSVTFFITLLIIFVIGLTFFIKIKKHKDINKSLTGFAFCIEVVYTFFFNLLETLFGKRITKIILPYLLTIFLFFMVGNLVSIFGLYPIAAQICVPITFGILTLLGILLFGFWHMKIRFLKKFANPFDIIGFVSSTISISFRLFGNIFGGFVITELIKKFSDKLSIENINYLFILLYPVLSLYLDFFVVVIQSFIFVLLTAIYWQMNSEININTIEIKNKYKNERHIIRK